MKRTGIRLANFLLLGAIINVAVAWGCAIWLIPGYASFVDDASDALLWWPRNAPQHFPTRATEVRGGSSFGTDYVMIMALNAERHAFDHLAYRWQYGWPARSLEQSIWRDLVTGESLAKNSVGLNWGNASTDRLPQKPIWPGFAINTVFYAAIVWVLFAVPGYVKRRRRIKRGLCPTCAYPVGASEKCSECGAAVKPQRGAGM